MLKASSEIRVMLPVCSSQYNGFVLACFPFDLSALYLAALPFDFRKNIPPVDLTWYVVLVTSVILLAGFSLDLTFLLLEE